MKKIHTHLTVIVFLITILVAGACIPEGKDDPSKDLKKVEIYCKAVDDNGVMKFVMYDSNDPTKVVAKLSKDDKTKIVADHSTDVAPKTRVTWRWTSDSEVQKFVKIGPKKPGNIIPGNAKRVLLTKKLRLRIPKDAISGEEKYDIVFTVKQDTTTHIIDPYLKIR